MNSSVNNIFLELVRLAIGKKESLKEGNYLGINWGEMHALAEQQGLLAVVLDGIEAFPLEFRPPKVSLLQWIGESLQEEKQYSIQAKASAEMALLFHNNYIRTYVLKGAVLAECYPKPSHRHSSDMDCFLLLEGDSYDPWALGNDLIKSKGYEVSTSFYKNSTFYLPGLVVENHKYLVPFRGNRQLRNLEIMLQGMLREDKGESRFESTYLYRPPVMVSSLFIIEHAYSHFLHEGLTWRFILDWVLFSKKYKDSIDWFALDALIDEFGFRKFFDSFNRLGKYLCGEIDVLDLTKNDKRMLADVWAPLDLHETTEGWKGKLYLAGNTWRARWKYHYFCDISMLHALWIQAKGVLLIKNPSID